MKKLVLIAILSLSANVLLSQDEATMPLTGNPDLYGKNKPQKRANPNTFDSTFIYTTDTIQLPLFDDFSFSKVQQYNAGYSDPGVQSQKFYRLMMGGNPMAPDALYTTQATFRRTFDTNTGTATDLTLSSETIQVGDLSEYPVVYTTTEVFPPYYIYDTIGVPDESDTVWLTSPSIYQDSATQFLAHIMDPSKYWIDDHAYHNYRFAVDPWSLGVMTFDGLDRNGYPYQMGTTITGVADYLTSKQIDMTTHTPADSVYLTFLVQREGFGDTPEETDSLILEFYDPVLQQWHHQWSINGGVVGEFILGHVRIDNAIYFSDAFQFRFKNWGGLSGSLDHFHLDYVHLRDFSGYQDTLIEDFAMVYPVTSLLKDYTAVPWDHYKNNPSGKMATDVEVVLRNSYLNGGSNISSAAGGYIEVAYNGTVEGTVPLNGQLLANYNPPAQPIPDYQPRTTYHSNHDVSSYQYDNSKVGTQQFFDIKTVVSVPVGSNFLPNDTAYTRQEFRNYYAHDDGTAEQAYGPQGSQARLAIRFTPYEADSVIGMYVHFVPTVYDVTNKLFQMMIWDDNGGQPGAVLYEDNAFFARQPDYGNSRNEFIKYFTADTQKVAVNGTFYIGWKQIDAIRLGVGLDRNTDSKEDTYFSLNGGATWEGSEIPGSVMIRPIFSTSLDPELGIKEKEREVVTLTIFPNPSNGVFHVESSNGQTGVLEVYSIRGELLFRTDETTLDLTNQPAGMYFVRSSVNPERTYKLMKGQ